MIKYILKFQVVSSHVSHDTDQFQNFIPLALLILCQFMMASPFPLYSVFQQAVQLGHSPCVTDDNARAIAQLPEIMGPINW